MVDLGAYAQIENLSSIMNSNGIRVPRLRGLRLMVNEDPIDIDDVCKNVEIDLVEDLCRCGWNPKANWHNYYWRTDRAIKKYVDYKNNRVRWELIHGKKRRILKTEVKNQVKKYRKQYEMYNKYAGKTGVLYIHARIGGGNWPTYYKDVVGKPWFIERIDDAFDSTYCDIYARIKEVDDE